ncbi:MAG: restriction endonuclease, partial [Gammaproteobacteria bacterium]|nr:restriction endonuclease [Gammaproteobacteria bacterium]
TPTSIPNSHIPIPPRSKIGKEKIFIALGYPIPASFQKTTARFPGQRFDIFIQKSNNLQVWNEEIDSSRRYVIISVSNRDEINRVKVVSGSILMQFDTTGTKTQKYQAKITPGKITSELFSKKDTPILSKFVRKDYVVRQKSSSQSNPRAGEILPIREIYIKLQSLLGKYLPYFSHTQERIRGAELHRQVCLELGFSSYEEDGKFPDIRNQLIEVKLQTSPTIDLGNVNPKSIESLVGVVIDGIKIRHCDVRYAVYYEIKEGESIRLTHLILSTGEQFFNRFPQMKGKSVNKKIQLHLPKDFYTNQDYHL